MYLNEQSPSSAKPTLADEIFNVFFHAVVDACRLIAHFRFQGGPFLVI